MVHIFIVNFAAGLKRYSGGLRQYLDTLDDNIKFYMVHTRQNHDETKLVREVLNLFEGEKIRIYSCGGSGTICNILNGIDDFSNVEIAFYPKGKTNDFLRVFGSDKEKFEDILELIHGEVHMIDYIKASQGVALNTTSTGVDAVQILKHLEYAPMELFGKRLPYQLALIYAMLFTKPAEYEIEYDGNVIKDKFIEIFFGNGGVLGGNIWFEQDNDIQDGLGKFAAVKYRGRIKTIFSLYRLIQKKRPEDDPSFVTAYTKSITVRRCDGTPFHLDFDGESQPARSEWKLEIVNKGLPFVVPKGVWSLEDSTR